MPVIPLAKKSNLLFFVLVRADLLTLGPGHNSSNAGLANKHPRRSHGPGDGKLWQLRTERQPGADSLRWGLRHLFSGDVLSAVLQHASSGFHHLSTVGPYGSSTGREPIAAIAGGRSADSALRIAFPAGLGRRPLEHRPSSIAGRGILCTSRLANAGSLPAQPDCAQPLWICVPARRRAVSGPTGRGPRTRFWHKRGKSLLRDWLPVSSRCPAPGSIDPVLECGDAHVARTCDPLAHGYARTGRQSFGGFHYTMVSLAFGLEPFARRSSGPGGAYKRGGDCQPRDAGRGEYTCARNRPRAPPTYFCGPDAHCGAALSLLPRIGDALLPRDCDFSAPSAQHDLRPWEPLHRPHCRA